MLEDKGILIRNIYYMLAYAFRDLRQDGYRDVAVETFAHTHDLFAALLLRGVALLQKRGLYREYVERREVCAALRGKLALSESLRQMAQRRRRLCCVFDELSENAQMNRILKTALLYLLIDGKLAAKRRAALKKMLLHFAEVASLRPEQIVWSALRYHRGNVSYRLPMQLCYLILSGLLLTTERGERRLAAFLDEQQMSRLYEKFILAYYQRHHPALRASASQISWLLDDANDAFLPRMRSDITLSCKGKTLIIDAKYYGRTMQSIMQYGSHSLHSAHLYQIFTYVKNKDEKGTGDVAGMLLYAKTGETILPNYMYSMRGNKILVRTLDLSGDFAEIQRQLDEIARWLQASAERPEGFA